MLSRGYALCLECPQEQMGLEQADATWGLAPFICSRKADEIQPLGLQGCPAVKLPSPHLMLTPVLCFLPRIMPVETQTGQVRVCQADP